MQITGALADPRQFINTLVNLISIDSPYTRVVTERALCAVGNNVITYWKHVHRAVLYFIIIPQLIHKKLWEIFKSTVFDHRPKQVFA